MGMASISACPWACAAAASGRACPPGARRTAGTPRWPQDEALPLSVLLEEPVDRGDLAHELIEPPVRRRELAQHKHQQRTRPAGPQEQRQMREVTAGRDGLGQFIHERLKITLNVRFTA